MHSNARSTFAASNTFITLSAISGPMPSPGKSVARNRPAASCGTQTVERPEPPPPAAADSARRPHRAPQPTRLHRAMIVASATVTVVTRSEMHSESAVMA